MKCPFIRLFVPQDTDEYDYYLTVISIWPLCLFISFMVLILEVLCIRAKVCFFMFAVFVLYVSVCLRNQEDH